MSEESGTRRRRSFGRRARSDDDPPIKSARNKIMDLLARRGYSELELREKLGRDYPEDEVLDAIENAKTSGWMTEPEELSERVTKELGRKSKGHHFIQQFLMQKGLPPTAKDDDAEYAKALELIQLKLKRSPPFTYEDRDKIYRWLGNRGFDMGTIRRVIDTREPFDD